MKIYLKPIVCSWNKLGILLWIFSQSWLGNVASAATVPSGFDALARIELLPFFLPNGTQTRQFISYDPAGENRSGFFKRYEENGEYVFFDEIGPGCLYRQQMNVFSKMTQFPNHEARIRFYFDNETKPRIDMTFAEFFGKDGKYTAPFTPPLAYYDTIGSQWSQGPGAFAVLYYPIPFAKRLKISAYSPSGMKHYEASWFQYTYLKYGPGAEVESWRGFQEDSPVLRSHWNQRGCDPKTVQAGDTVKGANTIPAGGSVLLLDTNTAGTIGQIRLKLKPWKGETFFRTRLRITWDNQPSPAVDMPLGSFFGAGGDTIGAEDVSGMALCTLLFGFDSKTGWLHCFWPMPFWSRAKIEIINESATPIDCLESEIVFMATNAIRYPAGKCGYFHAKRTIDVSPDKAAYSRAFHERGRGKVVGLTMFSNGYNMDGDEFTFIDDSQTPQIHGDGTEDDHNQGWGGYATQKPLWGGLVNGFQGGYRLYIGEPYVFDSSIHIHYEHSNLGPSFGQKTDFTVWYYLDKPGCANLKLTDEIEIANPVSEQKHRHMVTGDKGLNSVESSYDRYEQQMRMARFACSGRSFSGSSEFVIKIDPDNEGVKLRRRVNRHLANFQQVNVFVDGKLLKDAPWLICDLPVNKDVAFRDSDYEIPASLTRGKNSLNVRIEHVLGMPDDSSNEYGYRIYCYGKTPLTEPVLARPEPLYAGITANNEIELCWLNESDPAVRFRIQRRYANGGGWTTIAELPSEVTRYKDADFKPFASTRYRVQASNASGGVETSSEVELVTPGSRQMKNYARGAKARASSVWAGGEYMPEKAVDGDVRTRWNSEGGKMQNEWLEVVMEREVDVSVVQLWQETQWTRIANYSIETWVKDHWQVVFEGQNMPETMVCTFEPIRTRRVRLAIKNTTGNTPTIQEIGIYGPESTKAGNE